MNTLPASQPAPSAAPGPAPSARIPVSPLSQAYRRSIGGLCALAALLAASGLLLTNSYHLTTLTWTVSCAIAALGLFVLFGLAGQISLGQAAFFGLGAYTAANLVQRLNVDPALAIVAAVALCTLVGWAVARPLLRLSGNALAMASLAFGVVMFILFGQLRGLTGGMDPGISVRPFSVAGVAMGSVKAVYWLSAAALLLTVWAVINLEHSRFGRALRALKASETAARGSAVPTAAYKAAAFAIAAGLAGLAGTLYAFSLRSFNATAFGFDLSIELVVIVIVGSLRSVWGALFGAALVTMLPTWLEAFDDYKLLFYGLTMALIMIFMPEGLFHGLFQALSSLKNRLGRGSSGGAR